ncbi:Bcr/CflA family multidrug efflux MFS transporter [Solihabitans fulvus]|uniref:Bcr/CflA family multidrug efflux MFS transporter n=1 Tax=Solihabitans fulvus TaxID=1892852 RepID=A0A5B2XEC9_9PSEU|nr:Bcr/CflA family multidrug efflux MFS transporter [Solihabitans fulvus]KAA2261311.1 Bcr/CflA family multidrug efflux MFS transporter [Solihabitans fulvus]
MRAQSSASTSREVTAGRTKFLLILGGLSAFGPLSIDMYLPALPTIAGDYGTGAAQVQLTLTAFVIGLAFGQLVAGPLSDAYGRRRPLLIGLVAYALASVLCAFAPSVYVLTGLRLVQGFSAAAGIVIARAVVSDLFRGVAAAKFFSMLMLVSGLAPILAPVLGGQLLALTSWRGVFAVLTVFGVLLLGASVFGLPETLPADRRRHGGFGDTVRTFGSLLANRVFLGYALAGGLGFAAMFAYISGSSFVLQSVYGLSPQGFSAVFAVNAVGIVIAGQINGRLVGRVSTRKLLAIGLAMIGVGGVVLLLAAAEGLGLVGILPPLFVLVAAIGLVMPNSTALALNEQPGAAGTASALLGTLQLAIGGVTAPLVGLGGSGSAVPMAIVMAALGVLAMLAYVTLARGGRELTEEPELAQSAEATPELTH